jgi:hypothetical protein
MKYVVFAIVTFFSAMTYILNKKEPAIQNDRFSLFNNMTVAVAISGSAAKAACAETILDAHKRNYISINASESDLTAFCHEIGLKVESKIKGMTK